MDTDLLKHVDTDGIICLLKYANMFDETDGQRWVTRTEIVILLGKNTSKKHQ